MILAEKIALLRRQNGWSQEELADQLNVSRQAVSKWEGGTAIPDLDKILKLSALFEVSTDYLLKDELEQPDATAPLPKEERVTEPCRTVSFDEANAYLSTVQAVHGKMAAGVSLCILSPITLLVLGAWSDGTPSEERMTGLGVIFLLLFVALGLLQTGEYTVREKWTNRRVGWFAGAYWCLVTAVYLAVSFWNNNWEKSWIIWAVAGLVFAALYSAVRAWADRKNQ